MSQRLISIKRYCEDYSHGRTKTYELINAGILKTVRIGRRRLITIDSAEALIACGGAGD